jgi:hypothetical protein
MPSTANMSVDIAPVLLDDEMTALTLQLEEVGIFDKRSKGKHPVGCPPDSKVAFDSFQAEVAAHLDFLRDLKLAHSMAHAIDTDAQAIAELLGPDKQLEEDRRLAVRLHSEEPTGETIVDVPWTSPADIMAHITPPLDLSDDESEAGPSMTYAQRQAKAFGKLSEDHQCAVCYGDFKMACTIVVPCGDRYCQECLKGLFLRATKDETLFPPRCCRKPIPLKLIMSKLESEELNAFQDAETEFSTTNRTYCSNAHCGRFIPSDYIRADRAECHRCGTETCTRCKYAYHRQSDCPSDPELQATLSLAHEQGWQRCYACRSMVELDFGCNHMT